MWTPAFRLEADNGLTRYILKKLAESAVFVLPLVWSLFYTDWHKVKLILRRLAPLVTSFMIGGKDNRRNNWNKGQEPWNNRMKLEVTKRCVASANFVKWVASAVASNTPTEALASVISFTFVVYVIYQTRETVFHRDIQTPRRELKIRRAAEYF